MANITVEQILQEVIRLNASDLHIQTGLPPIVRLNGALKPIPGIDPFNETAVESFVHAILDENQKARLKKDREIDFGLVFGELGRFRVNAFHEKGNLAAALRLIPTGIKSISELNLPEVLSKFTQVNEGLVLFTGPTGSGKSTSLAALIDQINTETEKHIITIEDPIEFLHKSKKSVVVQRELGSDTLSFSVALKSALREDPDVVLVGEMRDLETISSAITISETGHLVFGTLHTNSAAQSIDRIVDVFPPHQQNQIRSQLSLSLVGICSQRLVPTTAGGRVCATEILVANLAVRNLIRENKTFQIPSIIQASTQQGMHSLDQDLAKLVQSSAITEENAILYSNDNDELRRLLGQQGEAN